jgi:hypothetical protein
LFGAEKTNPGREKERGWMGIHSCLYYYARVEYLPARVICVMMMMRAVSSLRNVLYSHSLNILVLVVVLFQKLAHRM